MIETVAVCALGAFAACLISRVVRLKVEATRTGYYGPERRDVTEEWESAKAHCEKCGSRMAVVRPGKWQCPRCE